MSKPQGWKGWDQYTFPFYDWENAQTLGRKDVAFWRQIAARAGGRVLELGCGTGRISLPLAKAGLPLVGVDRSAPMLERAATRAGRLHKRSKRRGGGALALVRSDIRSLPFRPGEFAAVIAPYGVLQSLLHDDDLRATLTSVGHVLRPGGLFGIDLVPDVPKWREYTNRIQLKGRADRRTHLTLVESVRQDRRRRLTTFEQSYRQRRGGEVTVHRFDLTFRTLPIRTMANRLKRAGFEVEAVLGDYRSGPWDDRADVWIILARKAADGVRSSRRTTAEGRERL